MKPGSITVPPLAVTVQQFHQELYPCSRAHANNLIRAGEVDSFVDGRRRMIDYASAQRFIARKLATCATVSPAVSAQKSAAGRKGRAIQTASQDRRGES